jgi:hypothetical protein
MRMRKVVDFKARKKAGGSSKCGDESCMILTNGWRVPTAGISKFPVFAAKDFKSAQVRFFMLSGADTPVTASDKAQLTRDRVLYADMVSADLSAADAELDYAEVDRFVLRVTSHPAAWLAAWNYLEYVQCLMCSEGAGASSQEFQDMIDSAYESAISIF